MEAVGSNPWLVWFGMWLLFSVILYDNYNSYIGDAVFLDWWSEHGINEGAVAWAYATGALSSATTIAFLLAWTLLRHDSIKPSTGDPIIKRLSLIVAMLVASLCGTLLPVVAPTLFPLFILSRAITGCASGLFLIQCLVLISEILPESLRNRGIAVQNAGNALGGGLGPFLGSILYRSTPIDAASILGFRRAMASSSILAAVSLVPSIGTLVLALRSRRNQRPIITEETELISNQDKIGEIEETREEQNENHGDCLCVKKVAVGAKVKKVAVGAKVKKVAVGAKVLVTSRFVTANCMVLFLSNSITIVFAISLPYICTEHPETGNTISDTQLSLAYLVSAVGSMSGPFVLEFLLNRYQTLKEEPPDPYLLLTVFFSFSVGALIVTTWTSHSLLPLYSLQAIYGFMQAASQALIYVIMADTVGSDEQHNLVAMMLFSFYYVCGLAAGSLLIGVVDLSNPSQSHTLIYFMSISSLVYVIFLWIAVRFEWISSPIDLVDSLQRVMSSDEGEGGTLTLRDRRTSATPFLAQSPRDGPRSSSSITSKPATRFISRPSSFVLRSGWEVRTRSKLMPLGGQDISGVFSPGLFWPQRQQSADTISTAADQAPIPSSPIASDDTRPLKGLA